MRAFQMDSTGLTGLRQAMRPSDHHLKHLVSRRAFLGGTAGVTAATLGSGLLGPMKAFAAPKSDPTPKPTISVIDGTDFHVTSFGPGLDPATITDFNGFVGVADVQGQGTATNPDGTTDELLFDTDMRFMSGVYVAKDGKVHKGTFGFV
jgi:hypothetical protein